MVFLNCIFYIVRAEVTSRRAYTLELAFDSILLRAICENEEHAKRELGPAVAEALKHRLADIRAATTIKDLMTGRPRLIAGADYQHMVVELFGDYRIVFCANHPNNPVMSSGEMDWMKISRIKLLRIEGSHG